MLSQIISFLFYLVSSDEVKKKNITMVQYTVVQVVPHTLSNSLNFNHKLQYILQLQGQPIFIYT